MGKPLPSSDDFQVMCPPKGDGNGDSKIVQLNADQQFNMYD